MLKASAGGSGKGMRLVEPGKKKMLLNHGGGNESSFGDGRVFIEKFITTPRHIEIQVLADSHGHTLHLGRGSARFNAAIRKSSKRPRAHLSLKCVPQWGSDRAFRGCGLCLSGHC